MPKKSNQMTLLSLNKSLNKKKSAGLSNASILLSLPKKSGGKQRETKTGKKGGLTDEEKRAASLRRHESLAKRLEQGRLDFKESKAAQKSWRDLGLRDLLGLARRPVDIVGQRALDYGRALTGYESASVWTGKLETMAQKLSQVVVVLRTLAPVVQNSAFNQNVERLFDKIRKFRDELAYLGQSAVASGYLTSKTAFELQSLERVINGLHADIAQDIVQRIFNQTRAYEGPVANLLGITLAVETSPMQQTSVSTPVAPAVLAVSPAITTSATSSFATETSNQKIDRLLNQAQSLRARGAIDTAQRFEQLAKEEQLRAAPVPIQSSVPNYFPSFQPGGINLGPTFNSPSAQSPLTVLTQRRPSSFAPDYNFRSTNL